MIGAKLKELRLKAALKQDDILKQFGLSSARYSQYETGKRSPDYDLLVKFADFYDVSVDYLLGRDSSKTDQMQYQTSPDDLELLRQIKNLPERDRKVVDLLMSSNEKMGTGTK